MVWNPVYRPSWDSVMRNAPLENLLVGDVALLRRLGRCRMLMTRILVHTKIHRSAIRLIAQEKAIE
jgi:hypothetical protein